jgi:hypothetical protein
LELFEKAMKKELAFNADTNFYLCSDDEETKVHFQTGGWKGKVKMPSGFFPVIQRKESYRQPVKCLHFPKPEDFGLLLEFLRRGCISFREYRD